MENLQCGEIGLSANFNCSLFTILRSGHEHDTPVGLNTSEKSSLSGCRRGQQCSRIRLHPIWLLDPEADFDVSSEPSTLLQLSQDCCRSFCRVEKFEMQRAYTTHIHPCQSCQDMQLVAGVFFARARPSEGAFVVQWQQGEDVVTALNITWGGNFSGKNPPAPSTGIQRNGETRATQMWVSGHFRLGLK